MDSRSAYRTLMAADNLDGLDPNGALTLLGQLIDVSLDCNKVEGTKRAIDLAEKLASRPLASAQAAVLNYFAANAWNNLSLLSRHTADDRWEWEQPEIEKQIIHLRRALRSEGFTELDDLRKCEILTNIANLFSEVGRFVEAQEHWNAALGIVPRFAMARGNRGRGLMEYASALFDDGHQPVFTRHAHADLREALALADDPSYPLHTRAKEAFEERCTWIESKLKPKYLALGRKMKAHDLGDSKQEIQYRKWCLKHRLFLNPLNDLGPYPIASHDCLTTPSIVVGRGEGPHYQGFFNQIKQEFVSARFLFYEGSTSRKPHFADKGVVLFNTLDYPSYSLAVEKVKLAFRMAYSLLDKIAFFLNHYLGLNIPERAVGFRTFWYEKQQKDRGLRGEFKKYRNWPLRGLFWISKDLFHNEPGFKDCLEPDAQELDAIRNHAEHKYLKLHEMLGPKPEPADKVGNSRHDAMAYSLRRRDFKGKALRLLRMVRAAIIHLSLAIHCEEGIRERARPKKGLVLPMVMDTWDDKWKV